MSGPGGLLFGVLINITLATQVLKLDTQADQWISSDHALWVLFWFLERWASRPHGRSFVLQAGISSWAAVGICACIPRYLAYSTPFISCFYFLVWRLLERTALPCPTVCSPWGSVRVGKSAHFRVLSLLFLNFQSVVTKQELYLLWI